jgi:hypothetical protein
MVDWRIQRYLLYMKRIMRAGDGEYSFEKKSLEGFDVCI